MQYLRFILFISACCAASCSNNDRKFNQPKSDTAEVLQLAITTAFHGFLPDVSAVKEKYYFGDSILLTSTALPLDSLPTFIDTLKFKLLSENQLCRIIKNDSLSERQPNYLSIRSFEKSDTGYYVEIASLSCLPYGGGGSLGLYIAKQNDSFFVKRRSGTSIN